MTPILYILLYASAIVRCWVVVDRSGSVTLLGPVSIDPSTGQSSSLHFFKGGTRQWEVTADAVVTKQAGRTDLHFRTYDAGISDPVSVLVLAFNDARGVQLDGRMYKRAIFNSSLEVLDVSYFSSAVSLGASLQVATLLSASGSVCIKSNAQFYSSIYISSQRPGTTTDVPADPNLSPALSVQGSVNLGGPLRAIGRVLVESSISIASFARLGSSFSVCRGVNIGNTTSIFGGLAIGAGDSQDPATSLSVFGASILSGPVSVWDVLTVSSCFSVGSLTRLGSQLSLKSSSILVGPNSVLDYLALGSSMSVRSAGRFGSAMTVTGQVVMSSCASVMYQLVIGKSLSVNSELKISSGQSVANNLVIGGCVTVGDTGLLGSAFSLNSYARCGSSISATLCDLAAACRH